MTSINFSYYELSLLSFLQDSHPDKASDIAFIQSRANLASQAYSDGILNGYAHDGATELANEVLYQDLNFSKHDTLINILWNEFSDEVPQSSAREVAIRLQPALESTFSNYSLSDDFAYSPEYESLYTCLTGEITIWLETNGL